MRDCGSDLDCAYDLYGFVCISIETKTSSSCMPRCNYRGVFKADKHMMVAQKGGCRYAILTRTRTDKVDIFSLEHECEIQVKSEKDEESKRSRVYGEAELIIRT